MNLQELRKIRIKNDYEHMLKIKDTPVVSWEATKGEAPYVEEYLLTIRVRTYEAPDKIMNECKVRIRLPEGYPMVAPLACMEGKKIFHPNWYTTGKYSSGVNQPTMSLPEFIMVMIKTIQFDPYVTNPHSPSNNAAAAWFNKNKHLFPSDRQPLPFAAEESRFKIKKSVPKDDSDDTTT